MYIFWLSSPRSRWWGQVAVGLPYPHVLHPLIQPTAEPEDTEG